MKKIVQKLKDKLFPEAIGSIDDFIAMMEEEGSLLLRTRAIRAPFGPISIISDGEYGVYFYAAVYEAVNNGLDKISYRDTYGLYRFTEAGVFELGKRNMYDNMVLQNMVENVQTIRQRMPNLKTELYDIEGRRITEESYKSILQKD